MMQTKYAFCMRCTDWCCSCDVECPVVELKAMAKLAEAVSQWMPLSCAPEMRMTPEEEALDCFPEFWEEEEEKLPRKK